VLGASLLGYFVHCNYKATIYMPRLLIGNVAKSTLSMLVIIKADCCVCYSTALVLICALGRVTLF
jgi:hypothetical protein